MSNDALWRLPYYHGLVSFIIYLIINALTPNNKFLIFQLPREDAVAMLKKEGDFIIRTSEEFAGDARSFVLSTFFEGVARHYIFRTQNGLIAIDFKKDRGFATIREFVESHIRTNTPICTVRKTVV